ncbi:MAG: hypothetical protein ACRBBW_04775 [Cellvibrionaceae bacterium]
MASLTYFQAAKAIESFAADLPGPYGYERSIKITSSGINQNRFLISFPTVALSCGVDLTGLLAQLRLPAQANVDSLLHLTDIVHLGVEASASTCVCKLYGENAALMRRLWDEPLDESNLQGSEQSSVLEDLVKVHRALKWELGSPLLIYSDYDWLPANDASQLLAHIKHFSGDFLPVVEALLPKVHCPISDLHLLRVSEAKQGRLSLDLNLYDSGLTVQSFIDVLQKSIPNSLASSVKAETEAFASVASEALGHIAIGVGRDKDRFLSIYFGAQERGEFL